VKETVVDVAQHTKEVIETKVCAAAARCGIAPP